VLIAPNLSHTKSEIVPGALPCTSSCDGAVTSASATSGTVSETRAIGDPMLRIVDRPTRRSMVDPSIASRTAVDPEIDDGAGANPGACWACGAAARITMTQATRATTWAGRRTARRAFPRYVLPAACI